MFFSKPKPAKSSNISHTALSIYIKATYDVLASFQNTCIVCKNLSQNHGYYGSTITKVVKRLLGTFLIHIKRVLSMIL